MPKQTAHNQSNIDRRSTRRDIKLKKRKQTTDNRSSVRLIAKLGSQSKQSKSR